MSSSQPEIPEIRSADLFNLEMPTKFFVSLGTAPMLLGILSIQAIGSWLETTGISSEEVFRGERLPVLPFPDLERDDQDDQ
ncbi:MULTISPECIES: hypothetical protein [unclassified Moorena]|uniref:hypothetical protein n=1 Tax=unclassified Moorena TaxID=2683338 RepID=UPI0025EFF8A4|nr:MULTISPECIES: hypothetical protein [unclassified Moorena]